MLFFFSLLILFPCAQGQNISWAKGLGDAGSDQGYDISTDSLGNVYMTGWFSGTVSFDGQTLTSLGQQDVFIASFDRQGILNWVRQAGSSGNDVSASIVTSAEGDSYITGWFSGTCHFDDSTVVSHGSFDMFVAKYDVHGEMQWVRHAGGPLDDYGNRIALASDGGVTLSGSFKDTLEVDGTQLISQGNRDALFCHYSGDGQAIWFTGAGGQGEDRAYGIVTDEVGQHFVAGLFTGQITLGPSVLTCNSLFGSYLAKMSDQGQFLWAVKADGGANDFSRGFEVATDKEGNVYANGYFSGNLNVGAHNLKATGGAYDIDAFLFKCDSDGQVLWARHSGGPGTDQALDLFMNAKDEIIEVGFFEDAAQFSGFTVVSAGAADVYVARYDTSGSILDVSAYGGTGQDYGYGITGNAEGNIFLTGAYAGPSALGSIPLNPYGGIDIFIARIGSASSGLKPIGSRGGFSVFPNPATDLVYLHASEDAGWQGPFELQIMDMTGRMVYRLAETLAESPIDVSMLAPGPYLIRLDGAGFSSCIKLIRE